MSLTLALVPILVVLAIVVVARMIHRSLFTKYFKLTYTDAPTWTFLFFSAWAGVLAALFPYDIALLFGGVSMLGYMALLFLFVVAFPTVYRLLQMEDGVPEWLRHATPDEPILSLEGRFILAKTADVVFQQFAAGIVILTLSGAGLSYPTVVGVFVALFALAHLYIFATSGFFWGLYYTTFAALGGFAIPFFILFVPGGIAYALTLHMLFYVLSAAFFAKLPRPSKEVCRDLTGHEPVGAA